MEIRLSDRHVTALNFALIAAIAYFAALSADDLIARGFSGGPHLETSARIARPVTESNLSRASYAVIVDRDVFNAVKAAPAPVAAAPVELRVRLLGTSELTAAKPFAVIEDTTSHQQALYRLGDEIPEAGTLVAVQRTRVLINRDGQLTSIPISGDLSTDGAPPKSNDDDADIAVPVIQRERPSPWKRLNPNQPLPWKDDLRDHPHRSRSQLMTGPWGNRLESRIRHNA